MVDRAGAMRLLILNRRDLRNPLGGGAEIYTHEVFRRLADRHDIICFCSAFEGAAASETIDGITYVRFGSELSMHFHAFHYALRRRKDVDLIVDQFNGIGMMTCRFGNSLLMVHQLYDEFWIAKLGCPGHLFRLAERILLRLYRRRPAVTVSESTRNDLLRLGFRPENLFVVHNGAEPAPSQPDVARAADLIYLGRMQKTKNPADAVRCWDIVRQRRPGTRLDLVGEGEERPRLEAERGADPDLTFRGFVDEEQKYRLLARASVLLVPSIREGWGQAVIQANAVGTPAVGYRVPGIRDSVRDGETGLLAEPGNLAALADRVCELLDDKARWDAFSKAAREHAAQFSWDRSAREMEEVLSKLTADRMPGGETGRA
jgi:glycosyltransferase involved in cell wall biosynthesis